MRAFSQIHESRVSYYLVYATEYLLTSEGTEIRQNRHFAAIEAGVSTFANDVVRQNDFYATYATRPADLPGVETVRKGLNVAGTELMTLRAAPPAQDYTGPVLFEARAAAPMLAQVLGPAVNGARPPISFSPVMEQMLGNLGGKSDWVGRLGARVLPAGVSLVDDPSARDFRGTPLIGSYAVDNEGVRAQKVTLVDRDRKSTRLNSSHGYISYAVFCLKKKTRLTICRGHRHRSAKSWNGRRSSFTNRKSNRSNVAGCEYSSTWCAISPTSPRSLTIRAT